MGKPIATALSALLWKNCILQTRSRKSILGIGGWGAMLMQVGAVVWREAAARQVPLASSSC